MKCFYLQAMFSHCRRIFLHEGRCIFTLRDWHGIAARCIVKIWKYILSSKLKSIKKYLQIQTTAEMTKCNVGFVANWEKCPWQNSFFFLFLNTALLFTESFLIKLSLSTRFFAGIWEYNEISTALFRLITLQHTGGLLQIQRNNKNLISVL